MDCSLPLQYTNTTVLLQLQHSILKALHWIALTLTQLHTFLSANALLLLLLLLPSLLLVLT